MSRAVVIALLAATLPQTALPQAQRFFGANVHVPPAGVRVDTPLGAIEGLASTPADAGNIEVFKGIPYAEAPVGALRFAPAQPKLPWAADQRLNAHECLLRGNIVVTSQAITAYRHCLGVHFVTHTFPGVGMGASASRARP